MIWLSVFTLNDPVSLFYMETVGNWIWKACPQKIAFGLIYRSIISTCFQRTETHSRQLKQKENQWPDSGSLIMPGHCLYLCFPLCASYIFRSAFSMWLEKWPLAIPSLYHFYTFVAQNSRQRGRIFPSGFNRKVPKWVTLARGKTNRDRLPFIMNSWHWERLGWPHQSDAEQR